MVTRLKGENKMSTDRFGFILIGIVISFIIIATSIITYSNYKIEKMYITNGYEEVMVIGNDYPIWKKIR